MPVAFLFVLFSFFQTLHAGTLDTNALRTCAQLLSAELGAPTHPYERWDLLISDLKQDSEATVLVKLDASQIQFGPLRNRVNYPGLLSPEELVSFTPSRRALFIVVHGSRENLTAAAQDMSTRFPLDALSYRILLSRPAPSPGAPEFLKARGLSFELAEAIERCFYTTCETIEAEPPPTGEKPTEPADMTIVTNKVRDELISFLRNHASTAELARIKIEANYGLIVLMEDFVKTTNADVSKTNIKNEFAATNPRKSDGAGFRSNQPKAVERVLSAWLVLIKLMDESLLADPFSAKTFFLLDQIYHARKQDLISHKVASQFLGMIESGFRRGYLQEQSLLPAFKEIISRLPPSDARGWGLEYIESIGFQPSDYKNLRSREARRRLEKGMRVLLALTDLETPEEINEDVITELANNISLTEKP